MNKRQIILDFTSLLDVIMILLFFFILFAAKESDEKKAELEDEKQQLIAEYNAKNSEAEQALSKAKEALAEYQEALSDLENSGESAAQNIAAMHKFDQSMNLKIYMKMDSQNTNFCQLDIFSGTDKEDKLGEIKIDNISSADKDMDSMVQALSELLNKAGYTEESTILCEFFYNGKENNTSKAYPIAEDLFKRIKFSYRNFKVSVTNTSIFTQANTTEEDIKNGKK